MLGNTFFPFWSQGCSPSRLMRSSGQGQGTWLSVESTQLGMTVRFGWVAVPRMGSSAIPWNSRACACDVRAQVRERMGCDLVPAPIQELPVGQ
jgi:hypothetical protein